MNRMLVVWMLCVGLLTMGSGVFAANPHDDVGRPYAGITDEQAGRIAEVLTLNGAASDEVRSVRTVVFLERVSRELAGTLGDPGKAVDAALDYLVSLPAGEVVPSSGSGGYQPWCVSQFRAIMQNCPRPPIGLPCWGNAFRQFFNCFLEFGTCSGVVYANQGGPTESRGGLLLGLGADGKLNIRFQVIWTGVSANAIRIRVRRHCEGGVVKETNAGTLDQATNPSGTWTAAASIPECGTMRDIRAVFVEILVDKQVDPLLPPNGEWRLQIDCM